MKETTIGANNKWPIETLSDIMDSRSQLNPGRQHPNQSHSSKPNSFILTWVPNPESQSALGVLKYRVRHYKEPKVCGSGMQTSCFPWSHTNFQKPITLLRQLMGPSRMQALWGSPTEVLAKSQPPPPRNVCQQAAPGSGHGEWEQVRSYMRCPSSCQRKGWQGVAPTVICVSPNAQAPHLHSPQECRRVLAFRKKPITDWRAGFRERERWCLDREDKLYTKGGSP